jgi:hypothetical protein
LPSRLAATIASWDDSTIAANRERATAFPARRRFRIEVPIARNSTRKAELTTAETPSEEMERAWVRFAGTLAGENWAAAIPV